jgi:signal peptidase II
MLGRVGVNLARRAVVFFGVATVSTALDQITKIVATAELKGNPMSSYWGDVFRLQFATNDGAFLSLGSSLPTTVRFFILTVGVGVLLLGIALFSLFGKGLDTTQVAGYALIVSGGASNWFDRARFDGLVVDFMNLGLGSLRTGIFNVADLAIVAGIGVLLVHGWRQERLAKRAAAPSV